MEILKIWIWSSDMTLENILYNSYFTLIFGKYIWQNTEDILTLAGLCVLVVPVVGSPTGSEPLCKKRLFF